MKSGIDMKREIIMSYEELIKNCHKLIAKGIDVEKNMKLMGEYSINLNKVKEKSSEEYDKITEEMRKVSSVSFLDYF